VQDAVDMDKGSGLGLVGFKSCVSTASGCWAEGAILGWRSAAEEECLGRERGTFSNAAPRDDLVIRCIYGVFSWQSVGASDACATSNCDEMGSTGKKRNAREREREREGLLDA